MSEPAENAASVKPPTARERAREEAMEAWPFKGPTFAGVEHRSQAVADAASDVWEPLLREALGSLTVLASGDDVLDPDDLDQLVIRLKEALDG